MLGSDPTDVYDRSAMRSALTACVLLAAQAMLVVTLSLGAPCPERCPDDGRGSKRLRHGLRKHEEKESTDRPGKPL